jgi:hypothetical protein
MKNPQNQVTVNQLKNMSPKSFVGGTGALPSFTSCPTPYVSHIIQVFKVHQVTAHYHLPQKDLQNFTQVQSFLQHPP